MSVGLFTGILQKILSRKARIAAKRIKGLRVHSLSAKLAVTTLLLMLLMAGIEPNPGPLSSSDEKGEAPRHQNGNNDNDNQYAGDVNTQQQFDRLFSAINDFSRKVSHLTERISLFEETQQSIKTHIDNCMGDMKNLIDFKLSEVEENQNILRLDIEGLDDRCSTTETRISHLEEKILQLEERQEVSDNLSRRHNLLFFGIPRVTGETYESMESKVRGIIRDHMKMQETVFIEQARRVGSAILVRFQSLKQRDMVLSHVRELRAINSPVYVREDFTAAVRQKRSALTPLMMQMRNDGRRAKLHSDKLVTDSGTFVFDLNRQEYQRLERPRPAQPPRHGEVQSESHSNRDSGQAQRQHFNKQTSDRSGPSHSHRQGATESGNKDFSARASSRGDDHTQSYRHDREHRGRSSDTSNADTHNTPGVNTPPGSYTQRDQSQGARATVTKLRGFGRGRGGSPRSTHTQPGHASLHRTESGGTTVDKEGGGHPHCTRDTGQTATVVSDNDSPGPSSVQSRHSRFDCDPMEEDPASNW